ncbi:hypothetical protein [Aureliella helgolandensis]|uniref:Transmembrane protein n=1 Tax=Aureliella helgolandensis TaxID=2527968 RepID=A0A518GEE0_9BACT|nr:hypothetical protein [Aureliella helgolandensis]QDV26966.1 hypothetical protein Q31a_53460 [Aureliella helgolandensis]
MERTITCSPADDAPIVLFAAAAFAAFFGYLALTGSGVNQITTYGALLFSICAFAAKLLQLIWREDYTTTVSHGALRFERFPDRKLKLDFAKPDVSFMRSKTRPWYYGGDHRSLPICLHLNDGKVVEIDVRFIWDGNRAEFLQAVRELWGSGYDGDSQKQANHEMHQSSGGSSILHKQSPPGTW